MIVGGSFGGLFVAKALRHAQVEMTVIDPAHHHLFGSLLHQLAT